MEAKELRIGNYIQDFECEPYYFQIEELRKYVGYEIWAYYREGSCKAIEPEPIPLTEEWLLKFGFNKKANKYFLDNFRFHIENPCNYDGLLFCDGHRVITEKIHFVNQLQNLYFALTGNELEIKK